MENFQWHLLYYKLQLKYFLSIMSSLKNICTLKINYKYYKSLRYQCMSSSLILIYREYILIWNIYVRTLLLQNNINKIAFRNIEDHYYLWRKIKNLVSTKSHGISNQSSNFINFVRFFIKIRYIFYNYVPMKLKVIKLFWIFGQWKDIYGNLYIYLSVEWRKYDWRTIVIRQCDKAIIALCNLAWHKIF